MSKFNWGIRACALGLLWAAAAIVLPAQTFTTVFSFDGTNGSGPVGSLTQATDGNLYGTTNSGGTSAACSTSCGTVFKITLEGTLTTLYSFCSLSECTDGMFPLAGLVQGTDGKFYGTTELGGAGGDGTVFTITSSGTLTTLHSFDRTDGKAPVAGLVRGADGKFYGTTAAGGANDVGTVFSITPSGTLRTLHSFHISDGRYPAGALVQGTDGSYYGTTDIGGTGGSCAEGCGTVFEITPSGTLTTLHNFTGTDGDAPGGGLAQGPNGNFYGTTYSGGANGDGTIFCITTSGVLTTLHNFGVTDGEGPEAGLVQGTDGNFYGTTAAGGANGEGTLFSITPSGTMTTLYNFCSESGCTDGQYPVGALAQRTNGTFYGTTGGGGTSTVCNGGCGTVFSLNVGLGQFVETLPTSGKVRAHITILGSFLTGATSVTFNGTAATFTINSKSEITTTVPTGATTGTVQVITPRLGTLSSNVPFTVRP